MKAANNKKRKIDTEASIPAPLSLKNQMSHYPLPGHNQNNFHTSYSPKYGDSISPASSGMSQCNQTNESGKIYAVCMLHIICNDIPRVSFYNHYPL